MRWRVLLIDENEVDLKLQAEVRRVDGFEVTRAEDAAAALSLLGQGAPDTILTDIKLPGINGLTLTRLT